MRTRTVALATGAAIGGALLAAMPAQAQPADIVQQVGEPVAGCAAVSEPSLNWSGVPSGGWTRTWGPWLNGGRGGSVCSRTLVYVESFGRWVVLP